MKKNVLIPRSGEEDEDSIHCLLDERGIIDTCLFVIDSSIRVCCNYFVSKPPRKYFNERPPSILARGRCPRRFRGARDWINILKSYWPGAGVRGDSAAPGNKKQGLAQQQDRGRCPRRFRGARFGTKAGLKPVHDGTIFIPSDFN